MIYGQTEVVKDLVAGRIAAGLPLLFEVADVSVHDFDSSRPHVEFEQDGERYRLDCDVIAGCDGFHRRLPVSTALDKVLRTFSREYPFAWLGILAEAPPSSEEPVYAHHTRGFALLSLRSPTRSRLYLQCTPDEDLEQWPDERIWAELATRTGPRGLEALNTGPILEKGVTGMRSFRGRADAARQAVPLPGTQRTSCRRRGAKGLNLAIRDVSVLASALAGVVRDRRRVRLLDGYSGPPPTPRLACRALLRGGCRRSMLAPPRRRVRRAAAAVAAPVRRLEARRRLRAFWPRTTSGWRACSFGKRAPTAGGAVCRSVPSPCRRPHLSAGTASSCNSVPWTAPRGSAGGRRRAAAPRPVHTRQIAGRHGRIPGS